MKSPIRYTVFAVLVAVGLCTRIHAASTPGSTPASDPKTTEVERTASILPLTLEVGADAATALRTLRDFTITVQGEEDFIPTIIVGPVNPFTDENTCTRPMPEGIDGCVVNGDATIGTLRVHWAVPEAGTYRFVLSGKRGTSDRVETIGAFDIETRD